MPDSVTLEGEFARLGEVIDNSEEGVLRWSQGGLAASSGQGIGEIPVHRSNLLGMGVLPLQFREGESREALELDGMDVFDIELSNN